jgi:hypothetical protein
MATTKKTELITVVIDGNGVAKHDGVRYPYKKGEPVKMPLAAAKSTGKKWYKPAQKKD